MPDTDDSTKIPSLTLSSPGSSPRPAPPRRLLLLSALLLLPVAGAFSAQALPDLLFPASPRTVLAGQEKAGPAFSAGPRDPLPPAASKGPEEKPSGKTSRAPFSPATPASAPLPDASADAFPDPFSPAPAGAQARKIPGEVPDTQAGSLGELTRLLAGAEIARAELALREVELRRWEIERKLSLVPDPSSGPASQDLDLRPLPRPARETSGDSLPRDLRDRLERLLTALEAGAGAGTASRAQPAAGSGLRVLSVRGQGARLEAEILGPGGRFTVRRGGHLPGAGPVEAVSLSGVRVAGRVLPWR